MLIKESPVRIPPVICPRILRNITGIQSVYLRAVVEAVSMPRHYEANAANNRAIADWIQTEFQSFGYETFRQGAFDNICASRCGNLREVPVLIAAHYDSVPGTPGADDNGSAIAAMMGVARAIAGTPAANRVGFVAFNREEDGMMGSGDFVAHYLNNEAHALQAVHVLEMVGYRDFTPGSQRVPRGIPIKVRDVGDFIGIITNRDSNDLADQVVGAATAYTPDLPVASLRTFFGTERYFPQLWRSDHAPFWDARIPSLMWTDTSEFRNPHYHQASDTPDTLDYDFLCDVTRLLAACVSSVV